MWDGGREGGDEAMGVCLRAHGRGPRRVGRQPLKAVLEGRRNDLAHSGLKPSNRKKNRMAQQ